MVQEVVICLICIDWNRGSLTTKEAAKNFHEMATTLDRKHAEELSDQIQLALFEEEWDGSQNTDYISI